jgi:hypothetical protein
MRYQMVIQGDSRSIADYDAMLALEEKIEQRLGQGDIVDAHDAGTGEWNIFLQVSDPQSTFANLATILQTNGGLRVGFRELGDSEYLPMFPPGLAGFRVR